MSAENVAVAIAEYQAYTTRAVTTFVRTWLMGMEQRWRLALGFVAPGDRHAALSDASQVTQVIVEIDRLQRDIARLLRRLDLDVSDGTERGMLPVVATRYRFALDELRSLEVSSRLASNAAAQAITTADQADRDRRDFVVALLTSVVLVPTLVASIYGANVKLPGKDTWQGLIALLLFIMAFGLASFVVIVRLLVGRQSWEIARPRSWLMVLGAAIVASSALAAGVLALT
jgi:hypothetical protein